MFALGAKEEYNYRQQIHLKVGRKLGTRLVRIDAPEETLDDQMREQDEISMKTALQLARRYYYYYYYYNLHILITMLLVVSIQ